MIKRIVKLELQADKIEAFQSIFEESKMKILARGGCFHVELLRSISPNNVFFTFSLWESEEALNAYRHSDMFKDVWPRTKACLANPAEAWSTTLDNAPWQ